MNKMHAIGGWCFVAPILCSSAFAQTRFVPIALTGSQAPGLPAGVTFSSFSSLKPIGDSLCGYVATLQGPGITPANSFGIWYDSPSGYSALALRAGDPAPGIPNRTLGGMALVDGSICGISAVHASLLAPGNTYAGNALFLGFPGSMDLVMHTGQQAPGLTAGVAMNMMGGISSLSNSGAFAFQTFLSGPGITPNSNSSALWLARLGQPIERLARTGDPVPGAPGRSIANFSYTLDMDQGGRAIVGATLRDAAGATSNAVLTARSSTDLAPLVLGNSLAPGCSGMFHTSFNSLDAFANARATISGYVGHRPGQFDAFVVFSAAGSILTPQFMSGDPIANIPSATIRSIVGTVAGTSPLVGAWIVGDDLPFTGASAVLVRQNNAITAILREGSPLPGHPGLFVGNFVCLFRASGGNDAHALFAVPIVDQTQVFVGEALFAWNAAQGLRLVLATGDDIPVAPNQTRRLISIADSLDLQSPLRDGSAYMTLAFDDGSSGIFRITPPTRHCTADFNADAGVTIDDLLLFLDAFQAGNPAADLFPELLGDGGVTIDDLLYFLQRYDGGC